MPTPCVNTLRNWSRSRPDVILAHSSGSLAPLLQATRTVPIVFTIVPDPVGAGYVESLTRPGVNVTGFTSFELVPAEMAGAAQADCAQRDACGSSSRIHFILRHRPVGCNPGLRSVTWRGVAPGRYARRQRNRPRHHGVRPGSEWRPYRDRKSGNGRSSQGNHHDGGAAWTAGGLFLTRSSSPREA